MTVVNTEPTPMPHPDGYIVIAVAANDTISMVGTTTYATQHLALTALEAAAAQAEATTKYYIVRLDVISGILATYSA